MKRTNWWFQYHCFLVTIVNAYHSCYVQVYNYNFNDFYIIMLTHGLYAVVKPFPWLLV